LEQIDATSLPVEVAVSALTMAELAAGPHAASDTDERARRQDRLFGREREIAARDAELRYASASGAGRLLAIRGRRQVGKSRSVEHFAERGGVAYGVVTGMKSAPVEVQVRRAAETLHSSTRPLPAIEAGMALPPGNGSVSSSRASSGLSPQGPIMAAE
jgi:predicted nucleic acid-binding protein